MDGRSETWRFATGEWIKLYLSNGDTRSGTLEEFWLTTDGRVVNITVQDDASGETITINGDHVVGYLTRRTT